MKRAVSISDEQTNRALYEELKKKNIILRAQNAEDIHSLSAYIAAEREIHLMDFFIIDLRFLQFSQQHILSSMQMMRQFCRARPIFIAEKGADTDILFGRLAEFGIKDCIAEDAAANVISKVIQCIDGEQSFFKAAELMQNGFIEQTRRIANPLMQIPRNASVTFAVRGAMPRVGTTTQAIGIYHYLKSVGFVPLLVDTSQELINFYAQIYSESIVEKENSIEINGVDFGSDILVGTPFNAFIHELGTGGEDSGKLFQNAYFPVLVGGAKEWEFQSVVSELSGCAGLERLTLILSFSTESIAEQIGGSIGIKAFAAPYMPDFWRSDSAEFYRGVFYEDLKEYCRKCEQ